MNIAIFSDNFYPELSGISDSLIEIAYELDRYNYHIHFFVPAYSRQNYATSHLPYQEMKTKPNISIHRLWSLPYPTPTKQGRLILPFFARWLSLSTEKPDIIHTHLFFGAGFEALAAKFFLNRPLVGTSHTPLTEFLQYGPFRGTLAKKLALRFVSWYYNRCDFVTAPSQGILNEMYENGFHRPSQVISNPINLESFFPVSSKKRTAIKKIFGLSSYTILYTGRLAPEKHIDDILRAVAILKDQIPDLSLAITGHGESEKSLMSLAKHLDIESRVKFFGTISIEDHARIYQASDIFSIMSTAETQSLSMMKAMATGIPVIGARARGLKEYIHHNENGILVEPGDYTALAENILFLYQHPSECERLGINGRATTTQYSRATIAAEWNTLYQNVLRDFNTSKK